MRIFTFAVIFCLIQLPQRIQAQNVEVQNLVRPYSNSSVPDAEKQELINLARRWEHSINSEKYACDSYYDYVCSRNRPMFSILGHLPESSELIQLLTQLETDDEKFDAKRKMVDFIISCSALKSVDDCYLETFVYFKPLFGYIIAKNYIAVSEHRNFLEILETFLNRAGNIDSFKTHPIRYKLLSLKEKFRVPQVYFRISDLNREYGDLKIYRESYKHNIRNLELHRKRNSTFEVGVQRTMLDWTLYVYQSRLKPMTYYFPTLNVHLWMMLFNNTEREIRRDPKRFAQMVECLKLPQFVNVIDEAVILAVVYLKSFQSAWQDFNSWYSNLNVRRLEDENYILKPYHLDSRQLFLTLYAQNFCDFGKELAENVFYLGLRENPDFFTIYSCGYSTERFTHCL